MKINPAIEPDIQEEILHILPDPPKLALRVMAQLTGNMLVSINGPTFEEYVADLKAQYLIYKGC
jgi:hypothetical protein